MDNPQKQELLAQLASLNALNLSSRGLIQAPVPVAIAGPPGSPVLLSPALSPLVLALRTQIDVVEKLTKVIQDLIDEL